MKTIQDQIAEAFHYRGDLTLFFTDNASMDGFLFNRTDDSVDILLADGSRRNYPITVLKKIDLSGQDAAAGKSYEEWLTKKNKEKGAS